jgi:hypothetical protein
LELSNEAPGLLELQANFAIVTTAVLIIVRRFLLGLR